MKFYMQLKYGAAPSDINWDLIMKDQNKTNIISKESVIKGRPADQLNPELPKAKFIYRASVRRNFSPIRKSIYGVLE